MAGTKFTAFENILAFAKSQYEKSKETLAAEEAALRALPDIAEDVLPADYSFLHVATLEEAQKEEPRKPVLGLKMEPRRDNKFTGKCLRLNNNQLSDIKTLKAFVEQKFTKSAAASIGWIDLSFNALTTIDPVLLEFENLEILYLHANHISNIKEVDKLTNMKKLQKLTLHGNEIEKEKGYRLYVLSTVPWLRNFDFSGVTKCEHRTAITWRQMNNPEKKKKKVINDHE